MGDMMNEQYEQLTEAIAQGDLATVDAMLSQFMIDALPEDQYAIAEQLMHYGYLTQADDVLQNLLFLLPDEPQLLIDRANVAMELGDEDNALDFLMQVNEEAEEYPQALLALADYYQMQGLFEAAMQRLEQALVVLPNEPLLQFAKAELLAETGRFLEASRLYEELYTQQTHMGGLSLAERLADVYRAGAAYEEALRYYKLALDEEIKPDTLFGAAYAAFQSEQYAYAIKTLEELKELDPDYFSAYLLLAQCYEIEERLADAYTTIRQGLQRDEYDKALYLYAGKLALKQGLTADAEQHLREAIALDPEYMEAIMTLMAFLAEQQQYEAIIELNDTLHAQDFKWTALYPFIAKAYVEEEHYAKAAQYYDEAYVDFSEDAAFLAEYVYFLLEEGRRQDALAVAQKLHELQDYVDEWTELVSTLQEEE